MYKILLLLLNVAHFPFVSDWTPFDVGKDLADYEDVFFTTYYKIVFFDVEVKLELSVAVIHGSLGGLFALKEVKE